MSACTCISSKYLQGQGVHVLTHFQYIYNVTHSHETSDNSFWAIWRYNVLKLQILLIIWCLNEDCHQKVLKLWAFEFAKHKGSHFEKTALKDFMCHFAYFP